MDAFDVLALAPRFDLDLNELERRYRELQRQLHPDKFAQASASERRASLARAVTVNDAYRVLRDELKRAELLLARLDKEPQADVQDPELLMEVMELRESLAEAKAARDLSAVHALASQVKAQETEQRSALREAFATLSEAYDAQAARRAARALSRLRYYRRFQDEVARCEEELVG